MNQDAVQTITFDAARITYTFTQRCVLVDLSGLTEAERDGLAEDYWISPDKSGLGWTNAKLLTRDDSEQTALEATLTAWGVTPTSNVDISLTAQEQADIEASGLRQKMDLPGYLDRCAQLRTDNSDWTDATVRSVAL